MITQEEIDAEGNTIAGEVVADADPTAPDVDDPLPPDLDDHELVRRKYYVDEGEANIAAEMVYELDANGKRGLVKFTDYTAEQVRSLFPNSAAMRKIWADAKGRSELIDALAERDIDFERLAEVMNQPDADPFDLLCHVAFNAPIRTRRERANRVKLEETVFFEQYTGKAREILLALLEKYAEHGEAQLVLNEVLKVPPLSNYGNAVEIAQLFGGTQKLKAALENLTTLLYVA